jgi:hypothetical protein
LRRLGDFNEDYLHYQTTIKQNRPLADHAVPELGLRRMLTVPAPHGASRVAKTDC